MSAARPANVTPKQTDPSDPFDCRGTIATTSSVSSTPRTVRLSPSSATLRPSSELTPYTSQRPKQVGDYDAATPTRNMLSRNPSSKLTSPINEDQGEQNASDITDLKSVLRKDFQAVDSRLLTSKKHYENLNARFMAAEAEHNRVSHIMTAKLGDEDRMSSLMTAKLLAEADGQELYAKRLRENFMRIDQQKPEGHPQMLQLTATPDATQHEGYGTFELNAGHAATQADDRSQASEDTVYADTGLQQTQPATKEQQSTQFHSLKVGDRQAHHDCSVEVAPWRPHAIAQLKPLEITSSNTETFSWEELHRHLGGNQYSPGLYYVRNDSSSRVLPGRTFWLLESHYEPFAPTSPGQHGAKLTAFFNDSLTAQGDALKEEDYVNVPVFICLKPGEGYTYLGQYSQKRYSDKLSHSELFDHIPAHILQYWANQLADPHRPAWITEQLIAHFWPPPPYTGPIPTDSALTSPGTGVTEPMDSERVLEKRVMRALERYAVELKNWKKDAHIKATLLTEKALMGMWNKSDMDEEKGLRLWWEYLECVGFDEKFYDKLVNKSAQHQPSEKNTVATEITDLSTYSGEVVGMQSKKDGKKRHDSFTATAPNSTRTSTPKEPMLVRANQPKHINIPGAFPQADLQAAREMHDKATKASDRKRGRSDKLQTRPVKW
jgi:hypothetical protein